VRALPMRCRVVPLVSIAIVFAALSSHPTKEHHADKQALACKSEGERCRDTSECCAWLYCLWNGICSADAGVKQAHLRP
jgi:hypothetical protein